MLANLAFSLSLYSGQMCTTPQNLLVPRDGITADGEHRTVEQLGADLAAAVDGLLGDDARANALLGAVVNDGVRERLDAAPSFGTVVLASRVCRQPRLPRRDGPHADGGAGRRGRPRRLPARVLRAGVVPRHHRQHAGLAAHHARLGARPRRHHRRRLLHRRARCSRPPSRRPSMPASRCRRTSPSRSTSTSRRRSATSTRPGANPAANSALTDAAYVAEPLPGRPVPPAPARGPRPRRRRCRDSVDPVAALERRRRRTACSSSSRPPLASITAPDPRLSSSQVTSTRSTPYDLAHHQALPQDLARVAATPVAGQHAVADVAALEAQPVVELGAGRTFGRRPRRRRRPAGRWPAPGPPGPRGRDAGARATRRSPRTPSPASRPSAKKKSSASIAS